MVLYAPPKHIPACRSVFFKLKFIVKYIRILIGLVMVSSLYRKFYVHIEISLTLMSTWSPSDQNSIARLESVQRHFTSKVRGMEDRNYWERLQDMQCRRERYMLIFLWKISHRVVSGYQVQEEGD